MYLTDEIFKTTDTAATADHPYNSPSTRPMDSNTPSSEHLGKRKRGAAGDHEYTTNTVPIKNIKILPTHLDPFDDYPPSSSPYSSQTANPATLYPSPPRHRKTLLPRIFAQQQQQQPRRNNNNNNNNNNTTYLHAPVRPAQRSPVFSDNHHHRHNSVARPRQPSSTTTTTSTTDLTPCHCCHRAPRQKPDLDNYSACAACGARTCYICMRVCERRVGCGSSGSGGTNNNLYAAEHENEGEDADAANNGRKICRACCVESGPEGETWCFDCVAVGGGGGGAERGEEEAEGMVMG